MGYMVEHDSKVIGPFTPEELRERILANEILVTDRACDQNNGLWVPLTQILSNKQPLFSASPDSLSTSHSNSLGGRSRVKLFAGMGGGFLALVLLIWRLFRILRLVAHLQH